MNKYPSKRNINEITFDADDYIANTSSRFCSTDIRKCKFQDLCIEILLQILCYLRPIDIIYSFKNLDRRIDTIVEPYTHTIDFRLVKKGTFQHLTKTILPYLKNELRVFRLSNEYTFNQISDLIFNFDWSHINRIESLTFDSIKWIELSRYFTVIHPILKHLWRLSIKFDEQDNVYKRLSERLLIKNLFQTLENDHSLRNCFITGVTFDLSHLNQNMINTSLHELKITLSTVNDLLTLFSLVPNLQCLTCTIVNDSPDKYSQKLVTLKHLTMLTLNIEKPILFQTLQTILIPHVKLNYLSLNITFHDGIISKQQIDGYELEKLFRTFSNLTQLHFYLRHIQTTSFSGLTHKSCESFLFPFTSKFWLKLSITVLTHFSSCSHQRFIYTIPFHYDTFEILGDINLFFAIRYPYYYSNVRHLILSSISNLNEVIYTNIILKYFPKLEKLTYSTPPYTNTAHHILTNSQWVQMKTESNSYAYTREKLYGRIFNCQTLSHLNKTRFQSIRQLIIHEMDEIEMFDISEYFPSIEVLILRVQNLNCFTENDNWLCEVLTKMKSLLSLTVYYSKNTENIEIYNLLFNTFSTIKKHFYIRCFDGNLIAWF